MYSGCSISKIIIVVMVHAQLAMRVPEWMTDVHCYYKRGALGSKASEYCSVPEFLGAHNKDWSYWDLYGSIPCWRVITEKNIPPLCQDESSVECLAKKDCAYFFHSTRSNHCESLRKLVDRGNITVSQHRLNNPDLEEMN